ncbi:hypothetical protein QR680_005918 [Steinernema hermaphroditum]|uniref:DDE Tnp4 domain-containing protein n=1 Tax=Steinernema hermaphroditum TaxID=289476 RepID=A0AA39HTT3_9BILA|nr:hypothetical protein QR680_005918 [Steinernema hermaphroditum]
MTHLRKLLLKRRAILLGILLSKQYGRARRGPTRSFLKTRKKYGEYWTLFHQLRRDDDKFFEYVRMKQSTFDNLLSNLRQSTTTSTTIAPEEMLVITLRFLATGSSYRTLQFNFRIGVSTIGSVIRRTCRAVTKCLYGNVKLPGTPEEWLEISRMFEEKWNFPMVLGAIDGKHVKLKKPPLSGSCFYNYKGSFSIVLMAVCDARYRFIFYSVGNLGHVHDSHAFQNSPFGRKLLCGSLRLPNDAALPNTNQQVPYFFLGDGAFPLSEHLMKPYAGATSAMRTTFNSRLSRARRVIENAFGILASRWRVLLNMIEADVKLADHIVRTTIHLHNFLSEQEPFDFIARIPEVHQVQQLAPMLLDPTPANDRSQEIREVIARYFQEQGLLPRQGSHHR